MAIPDDRFASEFVDGNILSPEDRVRPNLLVDYELGPAGLNDSSEGMDFQVWALSIDGQDIVLTPETSGSPITALSGISGDIEEASFCFDQNARPAVAYVTDGSAYLYWYDSDAGEFVTDLYPDVNSVLLSLDDKRQLQVGANDMLFWYTEEQLDGTFNLYHRKQRDRFTVEHLMQENTYPFLSRAGMHDGLRLKVVTRNRR